MALTYTAIADEDIDAESPFTVQTATRMRDNPIASHKYAHKSSAGTDKTGSTTLSDDADLQFSVAASQAYAFRIAGMFDMDEHYGLKIQFTGPAGATFSAKGFLNKDIALGPGTERSGNFTLTALSASDSVRFNVGTPADVDALFVCDGIIITGATAGTLVFQYAQALAGAHTTRIQAGAFMTVHRVDALT